MLLGILVGVLAGVIVAGGVLVFGHMSQGRRDKDDINEAFAEARGEALDPDTGPAPWSSVDMAELCEDGVLTIDRSDPYATLTGNPAVTWRDSSTEKAADPIVVTAAAEPIMAEQAADPIVAEAAADPIASEHAADTWVEDTANRIVAQAAAETWGEHAADSIVHDEDVVDLWADENGADMYAENGAETWAEHAADPIVYDQDSADSWSEHGADTWAAYGAEPVAPAHEPIPTHHEPIPTHHEPIPNAPEPVPSSLAPAYADDRPVVWRAPAESSVIILVVALRALADGVAATLAADGRVHLEGVEQAVAQARASTGDRENPRGRWSSIDVGGHERSATWNATGSSESWHDAWHDASRTRSAPRRPGEPDRIAWRAPGQLTHRHRQ
jgi:hypothetical protein